jgi:hypothetical protein
MNPIIAHHMQVICQRLRIPVESVVIVTDKIAPTQYLWIQEQAPTLGMLGAYHFDTDWHEHIVYVDTSNGRVVETLAHELRHAWQTMTGRLGEYDHSNPTDNAHERDARQWAAAYVACLD